MRREDEMARRSRVGARLEVGRQNAFTLVEILIVVVILGILAAIVTPQFAGASEAAQKNTTKHELDKLRRAVEIYMTRNGNALPNVVAGDGTWGEIVQPGEYLSGPPKNSWVGGANAHVIVFGDQADDMFQTGYGWIYDDATGQVWAGGFDSRDQALPK